ncbi:MAG: C4-dicarboxylate TRAP transporter substrate-binding protein [Pseudomonadota bacterium]
MTTITSATRFSGLAAGLAMLAGLAGNAASAQETINVTAIDGYPPRSMWVREFVSYFIPEVDRRLAESGNYAINWNQAWGGQIVKPRGVLEGLEMGLGDIGVVTTPFHTDKVPLQAVAYVTPFVTTDPLLVARTIDALADQFPEIREAFAAHNQVYLTNAVVLDSYQLFSAPEVAGLDDLSGLKVNGAGTNLRYLDGMGSTGVSGSLVTYYNNIQTGVADAALIWPEAAVTFNLAEVAPHMLKADIGTVNSKAITVNSDFWEGLPEEVQNVLQEVAYDYRDHVAEVAAGAGSSSIEAYQAAGGTVTELPADARKAWALNMPNLAQEWAAEMDSKGLPGSAMLSAYMDALREGGAAPERDWDRE